jgi:hypothetical protein
VKSRFSLLGLLLALAAATAGAQTPESAAPPTPKGRLPEAKRTTAAAKSGRSVIPDPDLLDGSTFEKEKRPLHGILSEIEMGEEEGGKNSRISPNSGPAGNSSSPEAKDAAAKSGGAASAAGAPANAGQGGADSQVPEGPAAAAEGTQVDNLKVPEGAEAGGSGADGPKPRDLQIGDASLQIQTTPKNSANVVGAQSSSSQQYEKKTPGGGSSPSTGSGGGVEKGRVVPKGL